MARRRVKCDDPLAANLADDSWLHGGAGEWHRWRMQPSGDGMVVWHDGMLERCDEVRISPFDQGLTIGMGVFETLVAVEGEPFAFDRHWDRLAYGAGVLGLPLPDREQVAAALRSVAKINGHEDGRLRITVTAGPGPLGSDRGADPQPSCLVVSAPRPSWPAEARVITVPWTRNERGPLAGVKSTSYAENALVLAAARRCNADEALMANTRGSLCEGSGSNVFVVEDGAVVTPPLADGCLPGVTRGLVLELAREMGIAAIEKSIPIASLEHIEQAFLTSTTRDIQPIGHLDGRPLPTASDSITGRLAKAWRERVFAVARPVGR